MCIRDRRCSVAFLSMAGGCDANLWRKPLDAAVFPRSNSDRDWIAVPAHVRRTSGADRLRPVSGLQASAIEELGAVAVRSRVARCGPAHTCAPGSQWLPA